MTFAYVEHDAISLCGSSACLGSFGYSLSSVLETCFNFPMVDRRFVGYVWILISLCGAPVSALSGNEKRREMAAVLAERFGTAVSTISLKNLKTVYERKDGSRYFEKVSEDFDGEVVHQMNEGEVKLPYGKEDRSEPGENSYSRVTVSEFEGKIFLKAEVRHELSEAEEGAAYEHSSTYEMEPVEGTWQGYQNGEPLKLKITARDQERYINDLNSILNDPAYLKWNGKKFREGFRKSQIRLVEKKRAEGADSPMFDRFLDVIDYMTDHAKLEMSGEAESASPVFLIEGDTLTENVDWMKSEMSCRFLMKP